MLSRVFIVLVLTILCTGSRADEFEREILDVDNPPQGRVVEQWMELMLGKMKVGYGRLDIVREGSLIKSDMQTRLRFNRSFISLKVDSDLSTVETLTGKPLSFDMNMKLSDQPMSTSGMIQDGKVYVTIKQLDMEQHKEFDWVEGGLMTWGLFKKSREVGLKPNTHYEVSMYNPDVSLSGPMKASIDIGDTDSYEHRGRTVRAIRTEEKLELAGDSLSYESVSWLDPLTTLPVRTQMNIGGFDIDMYVCTEQEALEDFVPADIFSFTLLSVGQAIPQSAAKATYRLTFDKPLDKPLAWVEHSNQKLLSADSGHATFEVTRTDVGSIRTDMTSLYTRELPKTMQPYLHSNAYMNLDDAELRSFASADGKQLSGNQALNKALELQELVSKSISNKTLQVGFASASETVRTASGDCTEHAVLLAALGRLYGIPTRVVAGLVYIPEYMERENIMGFHMWAQFYIDGVWHDFDAALPAYHQTAYRLALATNSLEGESLAELSLGIMDLIGAMSVSVESAK